MAGTQRKRPPLLHRQLMSIFVSAGLISAPGTPCTLKEVKPVVVWDPHTHTNLT